MSSHFENSTKGDGKLSMEYFGISIQCSNPTALRLVRAIVYRKVTDVRQVVSVEGANMNDLCRCWAKHGDEDQRRVIIYTVTPLSLAVRFSTNRIVRTLVERGADPNVECDMTPLGVAVQRNNKKLVAFLLDSDADINFLTHPVVKWNISGVHTRDRLMQTPLHISCRKGFVAMTAYLLLKQAATDVVDGSGRTPADVASLRIKKLIRRAVDCRTSMSVCLTPGDGGSIRIATRNDRVVVGLSQLILACIHNDVKKASCHISCGASVNAFDASRNTPLHYACANGNQKLVELLLENDARADDLNVEKNSPLQVALEYGYLEIVFILLEHKCVLPHQLLFATNSRGNTLLHIACKRNRIQVVKQLVEQGAFLNVVNQKGKSPIHYAWERGSVEMRRIVVEYVFQYYQTKTVESWQRFDDANAAYFKHFVELASYRMLCKVTSQEWTNSRVISEGIHGNLCSTCGKITPGSCFFLLSRGMCDTSMLLAGCCSRPCNANRVSLLHICCLKSTKDTVKQLVDDGADVSAVDCRGNTPLHLVCYRRGSDSDSQSVITTLLDSGANPHAVNCDDKTALWFAFSKNHSKLVRWLILSKNIDVDADVLHGFNHEGNTLLLMLATDADEELLWKLAERGARINVPHQATFVRNEAPSLLDVLAGNDNWSLIRKLVEVGCCHFTQEIFPHLFPLRVSSTFAGTVSQRSEKFRCLKTQMLKWFALAGFGQRSGFDKQIDIFLQARHLHRFQCEWESQHESEMSSGYVDPNAKARTVIEWLKHDTENPPSLSRLCVYTIRRQLIHADPDGKSIFPSIDELPLPTRLKDSLKLRDMQLQGDAECFHQHSNLCSSPFSQHGPYTSFDSYIVRCLFSYPLFSYPQFHHAMFLKDYLCSKISLSVGADLPQHSDQETLYRPISNQQRQWRNDRSNRIRSTSHSVRRTGHLFQPRH